MKDKLESVMITLIVVISVWIIAFITDYTRFQNNEQPLFAIVVIHNEDNSVYFNEYIGLGYKYIEYRDELISSVKFIPIWESFK